MTSRNDEKLRHDDASAETLIQEYRLDAPPDKVWRAISIPEFRRHWLPDLDLASQEPHSREEGREIRYVMRERCPPYLESEVALRIEAARDGGTVLTIVHAAAAPAIAANDDSIAVMRAA